ncbi:hypothetical protein DPMN_004109 [Dreissena polymorpha]|nr:hypothetical protein DPMN_004109 [Dreissena polymorpha]
MANLASSITQLLNNSIDRLAEDSERSSPLSLNCVSTYEKLLQHVFKEAIPVVQTSMKQFNTDVGVCTEGRKLIFFYGKFPQLEQKLSSLQQVCREPISEDIDDISAQWNTDTDILLVESWKQKPSGIMRSKGRPVKQEGKKIKFVDLERSDNAENDSNDYENDTSGSDNEMRGLKVNGMAPNDATKANGNHETQVRDSVQHKYVINSDQLIPVVEQQIEHDFVIINPLETTTNTFSNLPQTENVTTHQEDAPFETDSKQDNGASETTLPFPNEETHFGMRETDTSIKKELHQRAKSESASEDESVTLEQSHGYLPPEVVFLEKLILAQITVYAGTLAFQGNDSQVLMIIDKPVTEMLESVGANAELVAFCKRKHGDTTTLMDVDPSLIISVIDAVRYKSVMTDLVRSTVIDLIKHVSKRMRKPTLEMAYAFLGDIFSDDVIANNIADGTFLCELHESLQNVNDKLTPAIVEEIQKRCGFPGQKIVNSERSTT